MFTEEEQIEILEKLGYVVKPYSVGDRLRKSGYHAMVYKQTAYEVFDGDKILGNPEEVFKEILIKKIFNIKLSHENE